MNRLLGWERGSTLPPPARRGLVARARLPGVTQPHAPQPPSNHSGHLDEPVDDADDSYNVRELADVPSVEVISRAAVMLMSAAAEKLGFSEEQPEQAPAKDLDEARRLITGLAGLVTSSVEYLGPHAAPIRDGLQSLQRAFREASSVPDPPGQGPGEKYTGPVH